MRTHTKVVTIVALLALAAGWGFAGGAPEATREGPTITVASKAWTEQLILGNMLLEILRAEGYPVEDRTGLGDTDARERLFWRASGGRSCGRSNFGTRGHCRSGLFKTRHERGMFGIG